jgi:hypothetical protein
MQQLHHAVDGAASGRTDAADDLASLLAMLGLVMCSMDAEASQRDEAIVLAWLNARARYIRRCGTCGSVSATCRLCRALWSQRMGSQRCGRVTDSSPLAWACVRVHAGAKIGGPAGVFRQFPADLATFTGRA